MTLSITTLLALVLCSAFAVLSITIIIFDQTEEYLWNRKLNRNKKENKLC